MNSGPEILLRAQPRRQRQLKRRHGLLDLGEIEHLACWAYHLHGTDGRADGEVRGCSHDLEGRVLQPPAELIHVTYQNLKGQPAMRKAGRAGPGGGQLDQAQQRR
jgi:predicted DNA-binding protein with PD1-like motif